MAEPEETVQEPEGKAEGGEPGLTARLREVGSLLRELLRVFKDRWRRFAEINLQLGEYYLEQGQLSDATLCFRFVLWKEPQNADAWSGLGVSLLKSGRREKGVAALKKALQLMPDNARAKEALSTLAQTS